MKSCLVIAKITLWENLHKGLLYTPVFFLVFLLTILAFALGAKDEFARFSLYADGALFLLMIFNLFLSFNSIWSHLETDLNFKRLHIYLASYISRTQWVIGKFLGAFASVLLILGLCFIMISTLCVLSFGNHPVWLIILYILCILESMMIISLVFACAIFFSRFTGMILFVFFWILGHFSYYLQYYAKESALGIIAKNGYLLFPNFEVFSVRNLLISQTPIDIFYWPWLLIYTLSWTFFLLFLTDSKMQTMEIH